MPGIRSASRAPSVFIPGRLVNLRTLRETDAASLFNYLQDEKVTKYLRAIPNPYTLKDARDFIKTSHLLLQKQIEFDFGIEYCNAANIQLVGIVALAKATEGGHGAAEVGYWVGASYWNRGIASESLALVVDYAFSALRLHSVHAYVMKENLASIRVLEKCGFSLEKELPSNTRKDGRWVDEVRYVRRLQAGL
ncbi:MAG: GNAT family protein [Nitrososphaera sp.]